MSELQLYVDEDSCELAVMHALRARGFDLLTAMDAGKLATTDAEQLDFATQMGRAIYTLNVGDFARLHRDYLLAGKEHSGIIAIPEQRYSVGEKIRRLAKLLSTVPAEDMRNQMEYL
jgi:hypothetical protein